jgi:hypothetical protein
LKLTGGSELVDWVLVELRDAADPTHIVASKAALLQRDAEVVDAGTGSTSLVLAVPAGQYHVAVRHRNHLGIMTAKPLDLTVSPTRVAFDDPAIAVWGDKARVEKSGLTTLWAGDSNNDGRIIADGPGNDLNNLLATVLTAPGNTLLNANFITTGYASSDISMEGASIFSGINNDSNLLMGNVLLHPDNVSSSRNFVIKEQLPR